MPETHISEAHNLLITHRVEEELRSEGLRSVLTFFQNALMNESHRELPRNRLLGTTNREETHGISAIMMGDLGALKNGLEHCGAEHKIRRVIFAYLQIMEKAKNKAILGEKELKVLRLKIVCIASIGLILKNIGKIPEENTLEYKIMERLLVASLSATSMFEQGIDIPEINIRLSLG